MDPLLLEFLSRHPLFMYLQHKEIESLAHLVGEEEIPASSYVFLEEEEAQHFYILREGLLRAMIGGKLIATIRPGEFFGEIALLNQGFRTGSVFAVENSRIVRINGQDLFDGESVPVGFETVADLSKIGPALAERGYTSDDISAILSGNFLRILRAGLPDG